MSSGNIFALIYNNSAREDNLHKSTNQTKKITLNQLDGTCGIIPAHKTNIKYTKKNRKLFTKDFVDIMQLNGKIVLSKDYLFDINDIPEIVEICLLQTYIFILHKDKYIKIYDKEQLLNTISDILGNIH